MRLGEDPPDIDEGKTPPVKLGKQATVLPSSSSALLPPEEARICGRWCEEEAYDSCECWLVCLVFEEGRECQGATLEEAGGVIGKFEADPEDSGHGPHVPVPHSCMRTQEQPGWPNEWNQVDDPACPAYHLWFQRDAICSDTQEGYHVKVKFKCYHPTN